MNKKTAAERVYRRALKRILHSLFMKCECGASYVDADRAITQPSPNQDSTAPTTAAPTYFINATNFSLINFLLSVTFITQRTLKPKVAALLDASAAKVPRKWD